MENGRSQILETVPIDMIASAKQNTAQQVSEKSNVADKVTQREITKASICRYLKREQQSTVEQLRKQFSAVTPEQMEQFIDELAQSYEVEVINDTVVWSE